MIPELALQPAEGELDVEAIRRHLDSLDTAARDPQMPERFLLSSNPETLRRAVTARKHGEVVPYSVAVLHPGPALVVLVTMTSDTRPSRDFVEWLRARRSIRILDLEGNDVTGACQDDLDAVFGKSD